MASYRQMKERRETEWRGAAGCCTRHQHLYKAVLQSEVPMVLTDRCDLSSTLQLLLKQCYKS